MFLFLVNVEADYAAGAGERLVNVVAADAEDAIRVAKICVLTTAIDPGKDPRVVALSRAAPVHAVAEPIRDRPALRQEVGHA